MARHAPATARPRRVAEMLRRELAGIVQFELEDAQVRKSTLTNVDVAPDLSHAKVYVSHLQGPEEAQRSVAALNKAKGYLRHALAQRVRLRVMPELRFVYDESIDRGMALSALIARARAE
ncbi:MAG TPA: 30S ribosome-binding factor RbfA, partial [Casimicrobiaceae bacterium]|nr:30S ribosome-binding factor RbfA [Casimicrobiaceae bacterium]